MNSSRIPPGWILVGMLVAWGVSDALAAGQTSATYRVVADVFCSAVPRLAVGSAGYQVSLSVGQFSVAGEQAGSSYSAADGYQATTEAWIAIPTASRMTVTRMTTTTGFRTPQTLVPMIRTMTA